MSISRMQLESKLLGKYFSQLIKSDPLLKDIEMYSDIHAGGTRYQNEDKEIVVPKVAESFTIEMKTADIKNYDIVGFSEKIYEFTQERIERMHKEIFGSMTKVTQLTGNTIDAKGKPISSDLILDTLEKIWIEFDESGNPIMPTMVVGPEVAKKIQDLKETEKDKERYEKIIQKKKREFYAKKRYRRLSYID